MLGKEIKYTIDNFSEILEVNEDNLPDNKHIGVYFLYDENQKLLYIGKSTNSIRSRLRNYLFVPTPSLYDDSHNELILERRKQIKYFAYSIIPKGYTDMVERFLIHEQQCDFNVEFKY